MARNVYGGYCRECGRWTPPGFGHFERYRVWMGLEQCPSWWLDQNRFERA